MLCTAPHTAATPLHTAQCSLAHFALLIFALLHCFALDCTRQIGHHCTLSWFCSIALHPTYIACNAFLTLAGQVGHPHCWLPHRTLRTSYCALQFVHCMSQHIAYSTLQISKHWNLLSFQNQKSCESFGRSSETHFAWFTFVHLQFQGASDIDLCTSIHDTAH